MAVNRGAIAERTFRCRAYAKVNLGLEVLGLRDDGYHELRTIFQTIDLYDTLTLRCVPGDGVRVSCTHPLVPVDEANLAHRAATDLLRFAGVGGGLEIRIAKRIPVGGGLGGGSSDAAAVLMGLDRMLRLRLGPTGLYPLARRLGADVPFFLVGGTALGIGRGEEIYPLRPQLRAQIVVVDLARVVSTAKVFARLDARLTPRENSHSIYRFVLRNLAGDNTSLGHLVNELEEAAIEEAPELAEPVSRVKNILMGCGASAAGLSGSGASCFGAFRDPRGTKKALVSLRRAGFRAVTTRALGLDEYRRAWSGLRGSTVRRANP